MKFSPLLTIEFRRANIFRRLLESWLMTFCFISSVRAVNLADWKSFLTTAWQITAGLSIFVKSRAQVDGRRLAEIKLKTEAIPFQLQRCQYLSQKCLNIRRGINIVVKKVWWMCLILSAKNWQNPSSIFYYEESEF